MPIKLAHSPAKIDDQTFDCSLPILERYMFDKLNSIEKPKNVDIKA